MFERALKFDRKQSTSGARALSTDLRADDIFRDDVREHSREERESRRLYSRSAFCAHGRVYSMTSSRCIRNRDNQIAVAVRTRT